jgi:hypothetical protein
MTEPKTVSVEQVSKSGSMLDFNFLNNKSKITITNGIIEGALLMQNVGELKKLLVDSSKMLTASPTHYYFCMGLLAFMIMTQLGIFGLFSMIKTTTDKVFHSRINTAVLFLSIITFFVNIIYKSMMEATDNAG